MRVSSAAVGSEISMAAITHRMYIMTPIHFVSTKLRYILLNISNTMLRTPHEAEQLITGAGGSKGSIEQTPSEQNGERGVVYVYTLF